MFIRTWGQVFIKKFQKKLIDTYLETTSHCPPGDASVMEMDGSSWIHPSMPSLFQTKTRIRPSRLNQTQAKTLSQSDYIHHLLSVSWNLSLTVTHNSETYFAHTGTWFACTTGLTLCMTSKHIYNNEGRTAGVQCLHLSDNLSVVGPFLL